MSPFSQSCPSLVMRELLLLLSIALNTDVSAAEHSPPTTTVVAAGLSQPVEILRDRWGIAHIYARNEVDLFFAQGYNVARDRLFQLELWRLQATGTAAEVWGREELARDQGARLHQFRGDLSRELNFYHPRGKAIVDAFVRDVNAYIAQVQQEPERLPLEFQLLGLRPGRWTPQVVISRHQGLLGNIEVEAALARVIAQLGIDRVRRLRYFQGGEPVLTPDPAIDLAAIPAGVLNLYQAFRGPLKFAPERIAAPWRQDAPSTERRVPEAAVASLSLPGTEPDVGSNNWVIHGSRTLSSYPLLANDPHRELTVPSHRYWVHLVAPGWNVIGAGEPTMPGVSIGHNEHGAWGLTTFGIDGEDLYVYQLNPANADEYRYRGRWERMRIVKDSIRVRGEQPVPVEHRYTRHGPVLLVDGARHRAYALRAAWMEIGGAPYLASLRMSQARSWDEFREACRYNHIPAENMVWADRTGNIAYQAAGIQPLRHTWSGLLPVPGDGSYEWDGYLPIKLLPSAHNPAAGFIVTANHFLMPIDYPRPAAMHYLWAEPYRAARLSEVLGSGQRFGVAELMHLQNDELSIPARTLVSVLPGIEPSGPASAQARQRLLDWDFVLAKDSVAAGIYALWQRRLMSNFRALILDGVVVDEISERVLFRSMSLKRLVDQLLAPGGEFGPDPIAGRDALLARSLDEAVAELTQRFGADMSAWRYGQDGYHHASLRHPLSSSVQAALRTRLDIGSVPRGGDAFTVNVATALEPFGKQVYGASFKIIMDTEDWDNSLGQNLPGQSGDPDSRHYRDLFAMWAQGKYFPVAYSRAKVESVTAERVLLQPAAAR